MIELEVYAAGIRETEKILALGHILEDHPGLRYKVDVNHDIVYFEMDSPDCTTTSIERIFRDLDLEPRFVGQVHPRIRHNPKAKTQLIEHKP